MHRLRLLSCTSLCALSFLVGCSSSNAGNGSLASPDGGAREGGNIGGDSVSFTASGTDVVVAGEAPGQNPHFVDGFVMHAENGDVELRLSTVSGAAAECAAGKAPGTETGALFLFLTAPAAGTYSVIHSANPPSATTAEFAIYDVSACRVSSDVSITKNTTGTITIESATSDGHVHGRVDVTLSDGGTMHGVLDLPPCDAIDYGDELPADAGPHLVCS